MYNNLLPIISVKRRKKRIPFNLFAASVLIMHRLDVRVNVVEVFILSTYYVVHYKIIIAVVKMYICSILF